MSAPSYFPIQKQWRRLKPLFEQPYVLELMHSEMECYAQARATEVGDALNTAFSLAEQLIEHKATHGAGAMPAYPIAEFKRLALLLEKRTATRYFDQFAEELSMEWQNKKP